MASADAEKTEMKIEGTIEAAEELQQDPQSHVNPDIIEQMVVDEARQAGSAAYQFDPDASPETKANATKGVRIAKSSSCGRRSHHANCCVSLLAIAA